MIQSATNATLETRSLAYVTSVSDSDEWVRNPSWLPLPDTTGLQKVSGLVAIFKDSNFLAMNCAGNYTVNWGDGVTENINSGVGGFHIYDYNDADLANTNAPVTFSDSGDWVNRNSHGYANGMIVRFYDIVTTTGISEETEYYVINAETNRFQVSTVKGGTAIALTSDGSGALLPYKQAIVTIVPNGGNLTSILLDVRHSQSGLNRNITGWLDIEISAANATSMSFGANSTFATLLERVYLKAEALTSCAYLFQNLYGLQEVPLFNTAGVTNFTSMFLNCISLINAPLFDTASATNTTSMFSACRRLKTVPEFNTSSNLNFSSMFASCAALEKVPKFATQSGTNFSNMFAVATILRVVPNFNLAAATNCNSMFRDCQSLNSVNLLNTNLVTNFGSMFLSCYALQKVKLSSTAAGTDFSSMFDNCRSLTTVPAINVGAATSSASYTNMFNGCTGLTSILATGFKYTFSVASCSLSAAALNTLYGNLATTTGQTITVSSNWGTATDDPTLATGKGWTVTG
jgi:hypothetical protein